MPKTGTPLSPNYSPELDLTSELKVADAAHHQSLIGVPRWTIELGRVDICLEVSLMSSHLALLLGKVHFQHRKNALFQHCICM